eukprot:1611034-Alexandrium_andersonii.AAC.1
MGATTSDASAPEQSAGQPPPIKGCVDKLAVALNAYVTLRREMEGGQPSLGSQPEALRESGNEALENMVSAMRDLQKACTGTAQREKRAAPEGGAAAGEAVKAKRN